MAFLEERKFKLPPFATWSPAEWQQRGPECRDIVTQQLGWDITDFGSGDFAGIGLFLFTLRNGSKEALADPHGKTYAEKILIVREGQLTPTHFHHFKMEDIINRGGGNLLITVWNATADDAPADTPVNIVTDGVRSVVAAGTTITLYPGESICLPTRNYHNFRGEPGRGTVLVGEVSRVNDDHTDNRFLEPAGRFPAVAEDEAPLYLLMGDYANYYRYF